ncbi:MAG: Mu transposase domain-containing protein, partial [Solirubrobacteraceae bacterium]
PPRYRRGPRPSKLDPFKEEIHRLLKGDAKLPGKRIRELIAEDGYEGSKTILDDYLREVRPLYEPPRTYQRTSYRAGELLQFDVWEPSREIPVGHGQTRSGYVVTCALGFSRACASTLVFSKQGPDLRWGIGRCLAFLGALPAKLVWDREGALHGGGGRPTEEFAAFCGALPIGWLFCEPRDPEAKGIVERHQGHLETNFEPGRSFAGPEHYQQELDAWEGRVAGRLLRTIRARPAERLLTERESMRSLPEQMPDTDRRFVMRVPPQPYLRWDTNDYSLDPRLAGQRVEVRIGQRQISAVALDTGAVVAGHRRSFAKHLTFTDPAHQASLDHLRGDRRRGPEVEVELRPLARYDALIPA